MHREAPERVSSKGGIRSYFFLTLRNRHWQTDGVAREDGICPAGF
jgi:hypothetical protein